VSERSAVAAADVEAVIRGDEAAFVDPPHLAHVVFRVDRPDVAASRDRDVIDVRTRPWDAAVVEGDHATLIVKRLEVLPQSPLAAAALRPRVRRLRITRRREVEAPEPAPDAV